MKTSMCSPGEDFGQFGAMKFMVEQMISRINTMTLVKVISCSNSGSLSAVGYVDVEVLVNMLDGKGNGHPIDAPLNNLPYFRLQGGSNAIIIDPQPGDIGIAGFASRDISTIKNTKKQGNPGSRASHSLSDGLYFGGVLNGVPTQYIQFTGTGITIHSPTKIILSAPIIETSGSFSHTGTMSDNGKNIGSDHRHKDTTPGTGNSGVVL